MTTSSANYETSERSSIGVTLSVVGRIVAALVATTALALIGLFNVFGTYIAGTLGQRMARRKILSFIYFARAVAISIFLVVPLSPISVYVFSAVIGMLWLSTGIGTACGAVGMYASYHLQIPSGTTIVPYAITLPARGGATHGHFFALSPPRESTARSGRTEAG